MFDYKPQDFAYDLGLPYAEGAILIEICTGLDCAGAAAAAIERCLALCPLLRPPKDFSENGRRWWKQTQDKTWRQTAEEALQNFIFRNKQLLNSAQIYCLTALLTPWNWSAALSDELQDLSAALPETGLSQTAAAKPPPPDLKIERLEEELAAQMAAELAKAKETQVSVPQAEPVGEPAAAKAQAPE